MDCRALWKCGELIRGGLGTVAGVGREMQQSLLEVCGAACGADYRAGFGEVNRTVWKSPCLAVATVEQHLGIISLTTNTINFSFSSLQGEILHRLQTDSGHLSSTD